jgi:hypothetical protein
MVAVTEYKMMTIVKTNKDSTPMLLINIEAQDEPGLEGEDKPV